MREIVLSADDIWVALDAPGLSVVFPVKVSWPELRLTDDQVWENTLAEAAGLRAPHQDHTLFNVRIERG